MEEIKTVGDLRKFIASQGGEFRLGKISISNEPGEDVDIKYNHETMEWIPSTMEDERELSEVSIYSHMGEWGKIKKEELKAEPEPTPAQIDVESKPILTFDDPVIVAGYKAQGAAEVLEKIFINNGRKITLE